MVDRSARVCDVYDPRADGRDEFVDRRRADVDRVVMRHARRCRASASRRAFGASGRRRRQYRGTFGRHLSCRDLV